MIPQCCKIWFFLLLKAFGGFYPSLLVIVRFETPYSVMNDCRGFLFYFIETFQYTPKKSILENHLALWHSCVHVWNLSRSKNIDCCSFDSSVIDGNVELFGRFPWQTIRCADPFVILIMLQKSISKRFST